MAYPHTERKSKHPMTDTQASDERKIKLAPPFSKQGDHNARHDETNTTIKQRLGQERKKKKKKKKKRSEQSQGHKTLLKHIHSNILKISPPKNYSDKHSDIFHISAQNIDCGYSLEPPTIYGFEQKEKKTMYTPVNPSFTI